MFRSMQYPESELERIYLAMELYGTNQFEKLDWPSLAEITMVPTE